MATTPSPLDPRLAAVAQKFPRLKPYLSMVDITQGKTRQGDPRGLEFYPPWESENPHPGRITLELYRNFTPEQMTGALGGDLLHYLGGGNPQSNQPIDPRYRQLKQAVLSARTPQQDALDHRMYSQEVKRGEGRSFQDWLWQSRGDAYIRGWITPDEADEWRQHGFYRDPKMKQAVEAISQYLAGSK